MNATRAGLLDPTEYMGYKPRTPEAVTGAASLVAQAAGLSLLCSLALDSVAYGVCSLDCSAEEVAAITSKVLFECWDELMGASNLLS